MTSWFDLDSEDRAATMDRAEEEQGQSWYDLDPDVRGGYVDVAEGYER